MKTYIYYHRFDKTMDSNTLIKKALNHYLTEIGRKADCEKLVLMRETESKKPYLRDYPDIYYNVSHSGDWWVAAFGLMENGLDLQQSEEKDRMKTARRFFHPTEVAWLEKQDPQRQIGQFYRLWAYNESYIKFLGVGLTKGLDYFSVICEEKEEPGMIEDGVFQQEISFADHYWLVLTTAIPTMTQMICLENIG